jgi:hypothetical protein
VLERIAGVVPRAGRQEACREGRVREELPALLEEAEGAPPDVAYFTPISLKA